MADGWGTFTGTPDYNNYNTSYDTGTWTTSTPASTGGWTSGTAPVAVQSYMPAAPAALSSGWSSGTSSSGWSSSSGIASSPLAIPSLFSQPGALDPWSNPISTPTTAPSTPAPAATTWGSRATSQQEQAGASSGWSSRNPEIASAAKDAAVNMPTPSANNGGWSMPGVKTAAGAAEGGAAGTGGTREGQGTKVVEPKGGDPNNPLKSPETLGNDQDGDGKPDVPRAPQGTPGKDVPKGHQVPNFAGCVSNGDATCTDADGVVRNSDTAIPVGDNPMLDHTEAGKEVPNSGGCVSNGNGTCNMPGSSEPLNSDTLQPSAEQDSAGAKQEDGLPETVEGSAAQGTTSKEQQEKLTPQAVAQEVVCPNCTPEEYRAVLAAAQKDFLMIYQNGGDPYVNDSGPDAPITVIIQGRGIPTPGPDCYEGGGCAGFGDGRVYMPQSMFQDDVTLFGYVGHEFGHARGGGHGGGNILMNTNIPTVPISEETSKLYYEAYGPGSGGLGLNDPDAKQAKPGDYPAVPLPDTWDNPDGQTPTFGTAGAGLPPPPAPAPKPKPDTSEGGDDGSGEGETPAPGPAPAPAPGPAPAPPPGYPNAPGAAPGQAAPASAASGGAKPSVGSMMPDMSSMFETFNLPELGPTLSPEKGGQNQNNLDNSFRAQLQAMMEAARGA